MATDAERLNFLLVFLLAIALQTFLVMIIWNNVIIKKFPKSNIQELTFWDALAISVFVSILGGFGSSIGLF